MGSRPLAQAGPGPGRTQGCLRPARLPLKTLWLHSCSSAKTRALAITPLPCRSPLNAEVGPLRRLCVLYEQSTLLSARAEDSELPALCQSTPLSARAEDLNKRVSCNVFSVASSIYNCRRSIEITEKDQVTRHLLIGVKKT